MRRSVLRHLDPVDPGEAEVEDHEIGEEGMGEVERADAVAGDLDVVALHPQRALQDLGDRVVVLDDEHTRRAFELGHL